MIHDNTILIKPPTMYSVYLPATDEAPSRWINLANTRQIDYISDNPLRVLVYWTEQEKNTYKGEQAKAILEAINKASRIYKTAT